MMSFTAGCSAAWCVAVAAESASAVARWRRPVVMGVELDGEVDGEVSDFDWDCDCDEGREGAEAGLPGEVLVPLPLWAAVADVADVGDVGDGTEAPGPDPEPESPAMGSGTGAGADDLGPDRLVVPTDADAGAALALALRPSIPLGIVDELPNADAAPAPEPRPGVLSGVVPE